MRLDLRKSLVPIAILAFALTTAAQSRPPVTLDVHVNQIKAQASPMLHGLMTEEINYSYDGGLYAELVRNREFHANDSWRTSIEGWKSVDHGGAESSFVIDKTTGPSQAISYSAKVTVENASPSARAGLANEGYWGIPVRPSTAYTGSFYAKASGESGPIHLALVNDNTGVEAAHADVPALTSDWKQYHFTMTTNGAVQPSSLYRLEVTAARPGTFWFSMVSLFPPTYNNRPHGSRIDLMDKMAAMHPTFLRFPGGNYLEGNTIKERFQWKNTIGPDVDRPTHMGPWGYRSSDGMGLLEFLEWVEDMKAEPVLAVFAGYALNGENVPAGPALQPFVQEALDEIEYVTGDVNTKWGAQRARDGHPAPFKLRYVEIGNEDGFDKKKTYDGRYTQFHDAIKAKYPQLKLISTVNGKDWLGQQQKVTSRVPDLDDEHFYYTPLQMMHDAARYDSYERKGPKVFIGEWASQEGEPTTDLHSALADAAFMTGMERNADVVEMSCYAPLLVNVNPGGVQWRYNLVGYDAQASYGSPSYHVQKMFSNYLGNVSLPVTAQKVSTQTWQEAPRDETPQVLPPVRDVPTMFFSATRSEQRGEIYLKVVNAIGTAQTVQVDLAGTAKVAAEGKAIVLSSARKEDTNTIAEPTKVVPVTSKASGLGKQFSYSFAPYSVTVLVLSNK